MGSSRLPGKSLARLGDQTVIDWVVERVAAADCVTTVIVATSTNPEDDALAAHLSSTGSAGVSRGHPDDVLARYVGAIATTDDEFVVRITGDCPFVHPPLIDQAIDLAQGCDYVATGLDGRFPRGFDVEAVRRTTLVTAAEEANDPVEREHVTPFIVRRPERFTARPLPCPDWMAHPELRVTLDEAADLNLLRAVVDELGASPATLDAYRVVELLRSRPDLVALNAEVVHRNIT